MIDVAVYLSSLNKIAGRKQQVLEAFAQGARARGARVTMDTQGQIRPARLAVILGWASQDQTGHNTRLRARVIEHQQRSGNHVMAIDASTFKFHDTQGKYLRYSLNGVFYDTSEYANRGSNADRWNIISRDLNLTLDDWQQNSGHVLLLMQRDGGWSMKGLNPVEWVLNTHRAVRRVTAMPIMIRPHPGKKIDLTALRGLHNTTIVDSQTTSLQDNLRSARAACVFNSSSGVAAILQGIPLIVDDRSSVCWDVSDHDVQAINNPGFPDRTQWIHDLAAAHWSDQESAQGLVFDRFLPYIK